MAHQSAQSSSPSRSLRISILGRISIVRGEVASGREFDLAQASQLPELPEAALQSAHPVGKLVELTLGHGRVRPLAGPDGLLRLRLQAGDLLLGGCGVRHGNSGDCLRVEKGPGLLHLGGRIPRRHQGLIASLLFDDRRPILGCRSSSRFPMGGLLSVGQGLGAHV